MMRYFRLKLLVTIVDRGKGAAAASLYGEKKLSFSYLCMGLGTANSMILDYFGLSETEKDVVLALVPETRAGEILALADERFHFSIPGRGIVFTVPLSGASGQMTQVLSRGEECSAANEAEQREKEEKPVETAGKYSLILAIVNRGSVDTVMDAARSEGARGGTVLHARRMGTEQMEGLLGFTLQPEKDVVAILAPEGQKRVLMTAINKAAGLSTEARGILFSLPVDDLIGLQPPVETAD